MKMTLRSLFALIAFCTLLTVTAEAQQPLASTPQGWPRSFTNNGTSFTVYQPQATSDRKSVV